MKRWTESKAWLKTSLLNLETLFTKVIHAEHLTMSREMIISVMSKDRPGIVADITGAIYELGGDLADLNQSTLGGYLTMILFATFDGDITPAMVTDKIDAIDSPTTLDVVAREIRKPPDAALSELPRKTYIMTAQGLNRKGLVFGVSSFCFEHDINILDLATTIKGDIYTMVLQLDLSRVESIAEVRDALDIYAREKDLQLVLQHHDLFKVTHEIPF
jgi:glycine cleavage system transcriptional repressor